MKPDIEELRKKYIKNPPEGMTFWRRRFLYLLNPTIVVLSCPFPCWSNICSISRASLSLIKKSEFPIK